MSPTKPHRHSPQAAQEEAFWAEIQRVMVKHVRREVPGAVLNAILEDEERMCIITSLLKSHIELVQSRSNDLADAQVTIYDQALLRLTLNGRDLARAPAISLFVEEILGINRPEDLQFRKATKGIVESSSDTKSAGKINLYFAQYMLIGKSGPPHPERCSFSTNTSLVERIHRGEADVVCGEAGHDENPAFEPVPMSRPSPTERLLQTYAGAKAQYTAARDMPHKERLEAAIFLRDTCENLMACVKGTDIADDLMQEIEEVCSIAAEESIALNEGRKRKFDLTVHDRRRRFRPRHYSRDRDFHRAAKGGYHNAIRSVDLHQSNATAPSSHVGSTYRGRDSQIQWMNDRQMRAAIKRGRRALRQENGDSRLPFYTRTIDSYTPG